MAAFVKTAWVAHVWLTALLTLAAGFPHVQCRCPSGRVKPFCLGSLFPKTSPARCCCAAEVPPSGCCLALDASESEAAPSCCSCARPSGGQAGESGAGGLDVSAACCSRTLVPSGDFAPVPSEAGPPTAPDWVADLPSPRPPHVGLTWGRGLPGWQAHLSAPPTDLIVVLQHFTI